MAVNTKTVKKESSIKVDETTAPVDAEKDALKAQIEELKAQMQLMSQMMAMKPVETTHKSSDRPITFVNMSIGTLVLKGSTIWKIEGQFEKRDFIESEAIIIANNMRDAIRKGYVYISDPEFVESQHLTEVYAHLLTPEQLRSLFNKDTKYVLDAYRMAGDEQKGIIEDMVAKKRLAGESVDANLLVEIKKSSGKDFMSIEPEDEE